jgi:hypothetical protein
MGIGFTHLNYESVCQTVQKKIASIQGYIQDIEKKYKSPSPTEEKTVKTAESSFAASNNTSAAQVTSAEEVSSLQKLQKLVAEVGEESLTGRVIKTFGDVHAFNLPELKWQDGFHAGGTGYVDGISPSDMEHSVMWGIDPWNRLYIATKIEGTTINNRKLEPGVETFFQRYTNDGNVWTSGHHHGLDDSSSISIISSRMDESIFAQFQRLVKGEEITVTNYRDEPFYKVTLVK